MSASKVLRQGLEKLVNHFCVRHPVTNELCAKIIWDRVGNLGQVRMEVMERETQKRESTCVGSEKEQVGERGEK